mgnify:CR=1 FL=1
MPCTLTATRGDFGDRNVNGVACAAGRLTRSLRTFATKVEHDAIYVDLPDPEETGS